MGVSECINLTLILHRIGSLLDKFKLRHEAVMLLVALGVIRLLYWVGDYCRRRCPYLCLGQPENAIVQLPPFINLSTISTELGLILVFSLWLCFFIHMVGG